MNTNPIFGKTVVFNSFVRRQTAESQFTHWTLSDDEILERIQEAARQEKFTPSYRPDVFAVHIDVKPKEFYTGVVHLKDGDKLVGEYKSRRPGETPRIEVHLDSDCGKQEAVGVDIILYSHAALAENNENETDADYEIVSINGRITEEPQPIMPMTLMHNHFGSDGGSNTNMTPERFEADLREAFLYWKDKALVRQNEA